MSTIHKLLIGLLLIGCAVQAVAQEWESAKPEALKTALAKNEKLYEALPNMKLVTAILSFRNATDPLPQDKGNSVVWRTGDSYKSESLGKVTYQDKNLCVLIDPEDRSILLSAPTNLIPSMRMAIMDTMLAYATNLGVKVMGDGTHYRLKFGTGGQFEAIELVFDFEGWLRREELTWGRPVALEPSNPASELFYPKVVLVMDVPVKIDPAMVATGSKVAIGWKNGQPVALGQWKEYSVFDTRPQ